MFSAKSLNEIRSFMEEKLGVPGRDPWSLPTSSHTFPDGAHFRIEIAGVERASTVGPTPNKNPEVIRPLKNPVFNQGAIAILKGNLALNSIPNREIVLEVSPEKIEKRKLPETGPARIIGKGFLGRIYPFLVGPMERGAVVEVPKNFPIVKSF